MDPENEWRSTVIKWSDPKIEVNMIAKALHVASKGRAEKLLVNYKNPSCIYGRVSEKLFQKNDLLSRYLLSGLWLDNKMDIQDKFAILCGKRINKRRKNLLKVSTIVDTVYCWCRIRNAEFPEPYAQFVQCDVPTCQRWYHLLCSGLSVENVQESEFRCIACQGDIRIPTLFRRLDETVTDISVLADLEEEALQTALTSAYQQVENEKTQNQNNVFATSDSSSETASMDPCGTATAADEVESDLDSDAFNSSSLFLHSTPNRWETPAPRYAATPPRSNMGEGCELQSDISPPNDVSNPPVRGSGIENVSETTDSRDDLCPNDATEVSNTGGIPASTNTSIASTDFEYYDVTNVPRQFIFTMGYESWSKFIIISKPGEPKGYSATSEWANIVNKFFQHKNKVCGLVGKKKSITIVEPGSSAKFFRAYGNCKNKSCTAKYAISSAEMPKQSKPMTFDVRLVDGEIKHLKESKTIRQLRGGDRAQLKKDFGAKTPFVLHTDLFGRADKEMLAYGNLDAPKTLKTIQTANQEILEEGDLAKDTVTHLLLLKAKLANDPRFASPRCPGFIQDFSVDDFYVNLYYEAQLRLLFNLSRTNPVVIFFDATGAITKPLESPLPQTRVMYYGGVVKTISGEHACPIVEFYSASHTVKTISSCFKSWFSNYSLYCRDRKKGLGIARIEIDFSWALLASATDVFQSQTTLQFMIELWSHFALREPIKRNRILVHICRIHVERFMKREFKQIFKPKPNTTELVSFWMRWCHALIRSCSMSSMYRRMRDLSSIAAATYLTEDVSRCIEDLRSPTSLPDGEEPWLRYPPETDEFAPFYRLSPFGNLGYHLIEDAIALDAVTRSQVQRGFNFEDNPYQSNQLLDYMKIRVFPFIPILSRAVLDSLQQPFLDDHTNAIETYIGLMKTNVFRGRKKVLLKRRVTGHSEFTPGLVTKALTLSKKSGPSDEQGVQVEVVAEKGIVGFDPEEDPGQPTEAVDVEAVQPHAAVLASPEKAVEGWNVPSRNTQSSQRQPPPSLYLIPWSIRSVFPYRGSFVTATKTCAMDTALQLVYFLKKYGTPGFRTLFAPNPALFQSEPVHLLGEVLRMLDEESADMARIEWIKAFMPDLKIMSENGMVYIDAFSSVEEIFLKPCESIFPSFTEIRKCNNSHCPFFADPEQTTATFYTLHALNASLWTEQFNNGRTLDAHCGACEGRAHVSYTINPNPPEFIIMNLMPIYESKNYFPEAHLKTFYILQGVKYTVVAYSLYTGDHFKGVVWHQGKRYIYNGTHVPLEMQRWKPAPLGDGINSVWVARSDLF